MFAGRHTASLLVLLLLTATAPAFAQTCAPAGFTTPSASLSSWLPVVFLAMLVGFLFAAILYMGSQYLRNAEMEVWARTEFSEAAVSAFFVANALLFLAILNAAIVPTFAGSNDIYDTAYCYINDVTNQLAHVYGKIATAIFAWGMFGYLGGSLAAVIPIFFIQLKVGVSASPFYGLGIVATTLGVASSFLSFSIFSIVGQGVFLGFVNDTMSRFFLPLGIILRSFALTRRLGGTLMAVAIVLFIGYPMTMLMNQTIYNSVAPFQEPTSGTTALFLRNMQGTAGTFIDSLQLMMGPVPYIKFWSNCNNARVSNLSPELQRALTTVVPAWVLRAINGPYTGIACGVWKAVAWYVAIILWILDFIITLAKFGLFLITLLAFSTYGTFSGPSTLIDNAFDYFAAFLPFAIQPMIAAFLLPLLDIIVLVTAIRSLSPALGGEATISGLMALI